MVGAMDEQIGTALVAAGMPCFTMFERANSSSSSGSSSNSSGVGADHLQWGGEAFHKMVRGDVMLCVCDCSAYSQADHLPWGREAFHKDGERKCVHLRVC